MVYFVSPVDLDGAEVILEQMYINNRWLLQTNTCVMQKENLC